MSSIDHYCTIADVNALVPQAPFNATSRPTEATVVTFIEDIALEIDAALKKIGYTVPVVSGTQALKLLRRICSYGVTGLAQSARDTGVTTAVFGQAREVENIWSQKYMTRMKWLQDAQNPYNLLDAPLSDSAIDKDQSDVLRSMVQGITDDTDYDPNAPVITRNQVL